MSRLFISQKRLDEWVEQERVEIDGDRIQLQNGTRFQLAPAVLFVDVAGGAGDPHELLGRVKTQRQLGDLEAEHYRDSVILGDVAYVVMEGFVGHPLGQ